MVYTVAMTSTGQMTLPKALRVLLGLDGAKTVRLEERKNEVIIKRKLSDDEFFADIDQHLGPETRKIIREDRKKGITTVRQMIDEYQSTPEAKLELEEEYGPHPSPRYA